MRGRKKAFEAALTAGKGKYTWSQKIFTKVFFAGVEDELMLDDGEREEYKMLSERALTEYSRRCLSPCCDFTGMTMCDYVRNYLALSCSTMKCMEYFKYYLCTKCTYSWSITTWWEF